MYIGRPTNRQSTSVPDVVINVTSFFSVRLLTICGPYLLYLCLHETPELFVLQKRTLYPVIFFSFEIVVCARVVLKIPSCLNTSEECHDRDRAQVELL